MNKAVRIFYAAILLVLIFLAGYIYYLEKQVSEVEKIPGKEIELSVPGPPGREKIRVAFESDYEDVEVSLKNQTLFESYLDEKGILESLAEKGVIDFADDSILFPQKIVVHLTSEEQPFLALKSRGQSGEMIVVRSFGGGFIEEGKVYELKVYVSREVLLPQPETINPNSALSAYVVEGLYLISNPDKKAREVTDEFRRIQKEIIGSKIELFEVARKISVDKFLNLLLKQAQAQVCTGSDRGCYTQETLLLCSVPADPEYDCRGKNANDECGEVGCDTYGTCGICVWRDECSGFYARWCEASVDGASCSAKPCNLLYTCDPELCPPEADIDDPCQILPDCYWTGGPTPTPTPRPPRPTPPPCSVTAPYGPSISNLAPRSVSLSWSEGSGGTAANLLRIGTDRTEVERGCPGGVGPPPLCTVKTELGRGVETYSTGGILTPSTRYYWRVAEYDANTGDWIDFKNECKVPDSEIFVTLADYCPAPTGLTRVGSCDASDGLLDISWSWNAVSGATSYQFQLDADSGFGSPDVSVTTSATSRVTNNLTPGVTWYARVRVTLSDGTCTPPSLWSSTASITQNCLYSISGTVYQDNYKQASINPVTGICEFAVLPVLPNSGSVTVNPGGYSAVVGGTGQYSVNNVPWGAPGSYIARLAPSGGYACVCPAGCSYSVGAPQSNVNYFVSQPREGWFQTAGGDVHAEGSIGSNIPDTCVPAQGCEPYFSLPGTDEVGVVSSAVGLGSYIPGGTVSSPGWEAQSGYQGPRYLFDFWRRESQPPASIANLERRPSGGPPDIYEVSSATDLTLGRGGLGCPPPDRWDNINQPMTIFVNFTSDPANRWLTLQPCNGIIMSGGLLTIISNGNLQVADAVTQIQGIYLIDGVFRSCVTDDCGESAADQLQVTGSVIAWSGVDLQRDLFTDNNTNPGELFIYEPTFIELIPEFMLRAIYTWKEVAP